MEQELGGKKSDLATIFWTVFNNKKSRLCPAIKKTKQGWSEAKYIDEATLAKISLTVDYLKQEILDVKQRQLQQLSTGGRP